MNFELFILQLLNGVQLGVLLFLLASGLTLVFGILDLVNLAHGSLYMVGAFICGVLTQYFDSYLLAIVLAFPLTILVGFALERLVITRLYHRSHLDHVLATFGILLCIDTLMLMQWPAGMAVPLPDVLNGQVKIFGDVLLPTFRLVIIGVGLVVALGLYFLVNHTRLGMLIRAGASNRAMVQALGTNISVLFAIVFALGAGLAGLAGMLVAPISEASVGMGNEIIITAFVVVIIGGLGSIKGAFIAAIVIGLIDTMGRSYLDELFKLFVSSDSAETAAPAISSMLIYILMALILAFKPQGLFPPKSK